MNHRGSGTFVLHCVREHVHIGHVHEQGHPLRLLKVDEGPDVSDAYRTKELSEASDIAVCPGEVDGSIIGLWLWATRCWGWTRTGRCRWSPASERSRRGCMTACATPVISPHGHVDSQLLVDDRPFPDPRGCP